MLKSTSLLLLFSGYALAQDSTPAFKFAISGDSRNCGDVVMPAIAAGVERAGADFYWHLGDFRAIFQMDEDLQPPAQLGLPPKPVPLNVSTYLANAWPEHHHPCGPRECVSRPVMLESVSARIRVRIPSEIR